MTEVLLSPREAIPLIRILSPTKIAEMGRRRTALGTIDGPVTDETVASIVAKTDTTFTSNKTWILTIDGKPLEYTVLVDERSTWAVGNSPGGNFGVIQWKTGDKLPDGITVEIQQSPSRSVADTCWTKHTRSKIDLMCAWRVQMWNGQFGSPRTAEYSFSGRPTEWDYAVDVHAFFDKRWLRFCEERDDLDKRENKSGLSSSMFLCGRRPVFLSNTATQDEGRASEFEDSYNLKSFLVDTDLHFNRVPEVLIYDATNKTYHPISFHQIHRLGKGLVMFMTLTPTGYSWGGRGKKADFQWEYRLVNITIVGKREDPQLLSPSKLVLKRKALELDIDSDEERRSPAKKSAPVLTPGASGSGSSSADGPSSGGSSGSSGAPSGSSGSSSGRAPSGGSLGGSSGGSSGGASSAFGAGSHSSGGASGPSGGSSGSAGPSKKGVLNGVPMKGYGGSPLLQR
ncbi:hypothetical protein C8R45DRAFT_1104474 [Mycena sanguinolenta]|nr:hypothetical protein C8R45DRAFT_1104474 [Mycena sanguinolenta]